LAFRPRQEKPLKISTMKGDKRMNRKENVKICPFLKQPCVRTNCGIYHENFKRCQIDLIVYNLYGLSQALLAYKDIILPEAAETASEDGKNALDDILKEDDVLRN